MSQARLDLSNTHSYPAIFPERRIRGQRKLTQTDPINISLFQTCSAGVSGLPIPMPCTPAASGSGLGAPKLPPLHAVYIKRGGISSTLYFAKKLWRKRANSTCPQPGRININRRHLGNFWVKAESHLGVLFDLCTASYEIPIEDL